jgi:ubiquinone/menaquinone biosynthesis C-methylase UbiE
MGESVNVVGTGDGYRLWASTYDSYPNPLVALEQRIAAPLLGSLKGARIIDICAGTGRWMLIAARMRANVIGLDLSPEMLGRAARKPGLAGRLAVGDIACLPFASTSADLAICSFGMSYVKSVQQALREMARVAKRVVISDMHPAALDSGWTRSFETACRKYRIAHYRYSLAQIEDAAYSLGLRPQCSIEAPFGEPERRIFEQAGKQDRFDAVSQIPAIFVKTWA